MNSRNSLVDFQVWLGYDHVYTVNPLGTCGGLVLFWKKTVDIDFLFVDKNIMDMRVQYGDYKIFLSCVYENPNINLRNLMWERLTRLGIQMKEI